MGSTGGLEKYIIEIQRSKKTCYIGLVEQLGFEDTLKRLHPWAIAWHYFTLGTQPSKNCQVAKRNRPLQALSDGKNCSSQRFIRSKANSGGFTLKTFRPFSNTVYWTYDFTVVGHLKFNNTKCFFLT